MAFIAAVTLASSSPVTAASVEPPFLPPGVLEAFEVLKVLGAGVGVAAFAKAEPPRMNAPAAAVVATAMLTFLRDT